MNTSPTTVKTFTCPLLRALEDAQGWAESKAFALARKPDNADAMRDANRIVALLTEAVALAEAIAPGRVQHDKPKYAFDPFAVAPAIDDDE